MRKKTNPEKYAKLLAQTIIYDLIKNNRFQTIVDYVLLAWKAYPNLRRRELLNAKTIIYLNKQGKNAKKNIIKFNTSKLN